MTLNLPTSLTLSFHPSWHPRYFSLSLHWVSLLPTRSVTRETPHEFLYSGPVRVAICPSLDSTLLPIHENVEGGWGPIRVEHLAVHSTRLHFKRRVGLAEHGFSLRGDLSLQILTPVEVGSVHISKTAAEDAFNIDPEIEGCTLMS